MRFGGLEIVGIILLILLLFGPGRIAKVAGEMGKGIKAFKDGITGGDESSEETQEPGEED
jgi:sec-independent protein translocase protein TatA